MQCVMTVRVLYIILRNHQRIHTCGSYTFRVVVSAMMINLVKIDWMKRHTSWLQIILNNMSNLAVFFHLIKMNLICIQQIRQYFIIVHQICILDSLKRKLMGHYSNSMVESLYKHSLNIYIHIKVLVIQGNLLWWEEHLQALTLQWFGLIYLMPGSLA